MKVESNRIFISDLPETATQNEIQNEFGKYGDITSIEIKERKELGQKNTSLFFAYVTINTDAKRLNNCFNDFSKKKWFDQYVQLQIAKESFLERLKRERENNQSQSTPKTENDKVPPSFSGKKSDTEIKPNGLNKVVPKKYVSSESDDSSSESEVENKSSIKLKNKDIKTSLSIVNDVQESNPDFIIKNNKGKFQFSKVLKIESVGNEPIIKIEKQKKASLNTSEANLKRLESLKNLKQGYHNQKSMIQAALSNIDSKPKNKIIFDGNTGVSKQKNTAYENKKNVNGEDKKSLFNDSEPEEEFEPSFSVKEHFQGKKGQKLLELQSKFKNDKRFALDKRFLDDNEAGEDHLENNPKFTEDMSIEEEKKREFAILEEVLGKKIGRKVDGETASKQKVMVRYDPALPEHSKYIIPKTPPEKKEKRRKRKNSDTEMMEEKKAEEKDAPEVSKETFFSVPNNLKEIVDEKKEFSLLSMFGRHEEKDEEIEKEAEKIPKSLSNKFQQEKNPFKYDSSDDEDETKDIPLQDNSVKADNLKKQENRRLTTWNEPFFFTKDDYRIQEGFDFVMRMKSDEQTDFTKMRRDIKQIVKAKMKNNSRKNTPFKKKLGGSKKKKMLRIKKAMKR